MSVCACATGPDETQSTADVDQPQGRGQAPRATEEGRNKRPVGAAWRDGTHMTIPMTTMYELNPATGQASPCAPNSRLLHTSCASAAHSLAHAYIQCAIHLSQVLHSRNVSWPVGNAEALGMLQLTVLCNRLGILSMKVPAYHLSAWHCPCSTLLHIHRSEGLLELWHGHTGGPHHKPLEWLHHARPAWHRTGGLGHLCTPDSPV